MPMNTCTGATMMCSFGAAPSKLNPTPKMVMTDNKVAANIMDFIPIMNIPPFGMCIAPTNPAFIAATAAALGTPTPVPCMPVVVTPWKPGSPTVKAAMFPALNNTSTNNCIWLGVITFVEPGQFKQMVP